MANIEVELTDEELTAVRARADAERISVAAFIHDAVISALTERSRLFDEAAHHVLRASAQLNRRLA